MTRLRPPSWLVLAYVGAAVFYTIPPVVLYLTYRQPSFDLGIYDQTLWLLADGQTFNTVAGIHVLGAHFSPILYLLSPLSAVPGGAIPELVFEGLWMATAVVPIYLIARHLGRDPRPLVVLGVVHPGVFAAAWWGFRPWNLAYPVILWAALLILRHPRWLTVVAAGLVSLAFREDLGLWVGLVAVSLALATRIRWKQVVAAGVPIAAATGGLLLMLIPSFAPEGEYIYGTIATGTSEIPVERQVLMTLGRLVFLIVPVGLTLRTARQVRWLLAAPLIIPILGLARFSANSLSFSLQYDLLLVGVLVLVLALSPVVLQNRWILVGSAVTALTIGVLSPTSPDLGPNPFGIDPDDTAAFSSVRVELIQLADPSDSLVLPDPLVAHFSERAQIFRFPYPFDAPRPEPYPMICPDPDFVVVDRIADSEMAAPNWSEVSNRYESVWSDGRFTIYSLTTAAPASGSCRPAAG